MKAFYGDEDRYDTKGRHSMGTRIDMIQKGRHSMETRIDMIQKERHSMGTRIDMIQKGKQYRGLSIDVIMKGQHDKGHEYRINVTLSVVKTACHFLNHLYETGSV